MASLQTSNVFDLGFVMTAPFSFLLNFICFHVETVAAATAPSAACSKEKMTLDDTNEH